MEAWHTLVIHELINYGFCIGLYRVCVCLCRFGRGVDRFCIGLYRLGAVLSRFCVGSYRFGAGLYRFGAGLCN